MEPGEAAEKLAAVLGVVAAFLGSMADYRATSNRAAPDNPWRFANSAVCAHLDVFRQRLADLAGVSATALQFGRLERIEIGGSVVGSYFACALHTLL